MSEQPCTQPRHVDLSGLTEIEVEGNQCVLLRRGAPSVVVRATTEEGADAVKVERRGGTLVIGHHPGEAAIEIDGNGALHVSGDNVTIVMGGKKGPIQISSGGRKVVIDRAALATLPRREHRSPATVEISMPSIPSVEISGTGNVQICGLDQQEMEVRISGAGNLVADGRVDRLKGKISGVGNIDASALVAALVKVKVSGSGNADVHAEREVTAKVSGTGNIGIAGNPSIRDTHVSGVGHIRFRT